MKKFIKISAIACTAALFLGLVGCTKGELDTAQYSESAVTLASYGPNPVMRGGQLRFFGSNLQNVVEVNVPGVEPITAIEVVESGKTSEIRVTLPVEGPEVGIVTIKTKDGIVLKTKKELTYTEPIVFESFTVAQPAYPGDVITLKGDYMNLVQHVVFEGGETSPVLEGATRHEAKVAIPVTAVTGKIILSDGAEVENLLYSEEDLTIGKPSVTKLDKKSVKSGDEITFTGEHLEMFKAVEFTKVNETVAIEDIEVAEGSITVAIPETATNGMVQAVSYAGDKFDICDIECILPTDLSVANTPKATRDSLIIEGKDLDVVVKVDLAGAENAGFASEDGKLKVAVPATAKKGTAKIFHSNGEFVEVDYDIVHPAITNVTPLELYAGDEPVIVEGTDLDLVASAKIGAKDVEIAEKTETKLTLATAVTSVSGKVVLTLANGETLESEQEVKMNYHSKVILTSRPVAEHIGMPVVLKGQGLDLVESIFIGEAKVTKYTLRTAEEIQFLMPWNKVGSYELKFQLYDGDIEIQADPIEVQLELQTIVAFEGSVDIAWSAPGQIIMPASKVGKVAAGSIIRLYFTQHDQIWGQIQVNDGAWGTLMIVVPTDVYGWFPDGILDRVYDLVLTKEWADRINNNDGLIIQGQDETITKIEIINEIPQEVTLWEGEAIADNWGNQPFLLSDGGTELKNANAQVGQELRFYIEPLSDSWMFDIQEGHWGPVYKSVCSMSSNPDDPRFVKFDLESTGGYIPLTITQEILDAALTQQWWGGAFLINGDDTKFVKITLM